MTLLLGAGLFCTKRQASLAETWLSCTSVGLFVAKKATQIVTLLLGAGLYCRKIGFFGRDMALLHEYRALLWRYRVANRDTTPWGRFLLGEALERLSQELKSLKHTGLFCKTGLQKWDSSTEDSHKLRAPLQKGPTNRALLQNSPIKWDSLTEELKEASVTEDSFTESHENRALLKNSPTDIGLFH